MKPVLTRQQQKLLFFIKNFQDQHGISPSYDEMRCALNQKSKSSVHMLLTALVERGFIRKLSNKARAIEVIKFFVPASPVLGVSESIPLRVETPAPLITIEKKTEHSSWDVPFYGKQTTVFSLQTFLSTPDRILTVPKSFISYREGVDYCAIQMSGDSLKEMAILDNDILFFEMGPKEPSHQIVLAVVDDENIHMKRWDVKDDKVVLSLGNKYMIPQVYDMERVQAKGVLVGLSRKTI